MSIEIQRDRRMNRFVAGKKPYGSLQTKQIIR